MEAKAPSPKREDPAFRREVDLVLDHLDLRLACDLPRMSSCSIGSELIDLSPEVLNFDDVRDAADEAGAESVDLCTLQLQAF